MGALHGFEYPNGTKAWTFQNDDIPFGWIDWLGGGYILLGNATSLELIHIDSSSGAHIVKRIETLPTSPTNYDILGIAINHTRNVDDEDDDANHGFDGHQCYLARQIVTDGEIGYEIVLYDYETGNVVKQMVALSAIPTGIAWDGHYLWVHTSGIDGQGIWQYDVGNNVARLVKTYTLNAGFIDMAFDGKDFWIGANARIRKYTPNKWTAPIYTKIHSLGLAVKGITYDGRQIIISTV